jgi:hypothetical protein
MLEVNSHCEIREHGEPRQIIHIVRKLQAATWQIASDVPP